MVEHFDAEREHQAEKPGSSDRDDQQQLSARIGRALRHVGAGNNRRVGLLEILLAAGLLGAGEKGLQQGAAGIGLALQVAQSDLIGVCAPDLLAQTVERGGESSLAGAGNADLVP